MRGDLTDSFLRKTIWIALVDDEGYEREAVKES